MTYGSTILGSGIYGGGESNPLNLPESAKSPFLQVWIDGVDVTDKVKMRSKKITWQLAQRSNQSSFSMFDDFPSTYEEVYIYYSSQIREATINTITLNLNENVNDAYRIGDVVFCGLFAEDQRMIISTIQIVGSYVVLTFTENFTIIPSIGNFVGILFYAGVVIDISDKNIELIQNQEADIQCVGFDRIFDKKTVNNSWQTVDARYIINDFCNDTINKNITIDALNYTDNTEIQAEWIETDDGSNPIITSTLREGTSAGQFSWTFSGGTATFTASPSGKDISGYVGVSTGTPTKGRIGFWYKIASLSAVTSFTVRLGSSSSDYAYWTITPTTTDWVYYTPKFTDASYTGTVNFTDCDYLAVVVTETSSSNIIFDGFRVLENKFFNHYPYIEETITFDDFRVNRSKPMEVMQRIAETLQWYWHIDEERNIHLYPSATTTAPFELSSTSNNYKDLEFSYDDSRLVNRQVVEGGKQTSTSVYSQVKEGDGIVKEWILKNQFKNLVVSVDKNTSTDTMEAGTNTTTVVATAHGLAVGDHIVNRTRSNAVRQIDTVPTVDSFTVSEAVTGQTTGDTFSKFVAQDVGVEGINTDTGYNFMSNFNQKSIRNSETEPVLLAAEFIRFSYNEVVPILVQVTNPVSIAAMVSTLGYSDGIIDGDVIKAPTIQSRAECEQLGQAKVEQYGNMIITANFSTYVHGLREGQQIKITDTSGNRNIDQYFLIQQVRVREVQTGWVEYSVTCSTLLYGMLELLQQLLRQSKAISIDEDLTISQIIYPIETINVSDTVTAVVGGDYIEAESIEVSESVVVTIATPPYQYGPGGSPQGVWGLSEWS